MSAVATDVRRRVRLLLTDLLGVEPTRDARVGGLLALVVCFVRLAATYRYANSDADMSIESIQSVAESVLELRIIRAARSIESLGR